MPRRFAVSEVVSGQGSVKRRPSSTLRLVAAFTELVIPGNGTGEGQHYGTGVLPEHRGHGLGRWMKAESIRQAHRDYPDLGGLLTDTADSNAHMRRVNDGLGYTPTHTTHQYQLDL